jgi:N-acetylmuramic acid 6-phosphate etherase
MILGIEGGGTKTVALFSDGRRLKYGPLNLKLSSDRQILGLFRQITSTEKPASVAICVAGCRTAADRARLRTLAGRVWPRANIAVGSDLDSGHAAAFGAGRDGILVISGTGSCVYGRHRKRIARVGGWGHLLGDRGSGYWLALSSLRAEIANFDYTGRTSRALQGVLRRLCLNSPEQLVDWIHRATKSEIGALTSELINANPAIIAESAEVLAADVVSAAKQLRLKTPVVALTGGVFDNHPAFARLTAQFIRRQLRGARIVKPRHESAQGALQLAGAGTVEVPTKPAAAGRLQLTEQRNPRTMNLDKQSIPDLVDTMLREDAAILPALRANKQAIAKAIRAIVASFQRGGRLFYVGAGTSGRIGVLDASECPPTFSAPPDMVQGIIAGGATALHSPAESGEDDAGAGADAVRHRGVSRRDVVVGIAASGTTPFVIGALDEAMRRGAKTFLLSFSPPVTAHHSPLTFLTGPEVVTGSTRLKAGTATKLVLNMLTTISMIRLGKVVSNLMVDVKPTNDKLRARACRIVAALRGCDEVEARRRLERVRWDVKKALLTKSTCGRGQLPRRRAG